MSFVTISYCLDRVSGAIASAEPGVSLLYIWVAKRGVVGEDTASSSKHSEVKHELLKCFQRRCKRACISVLS